jgi:hypothetical protein
MIQFWFIVFVQIASTAKTNLEAVACLVKNCPGQVTSCLKQSSCRSSLSCLAKCPNEFKCHIRCNIENDSNPELLTMNDCIIKHHCLVPYPPEPVVVPKKISPIFSMDHALGIWYGIAGYHRGLDCWPCQVRIK